MPELPTDAQAVGNLVLLANVHRNRQKEAFIHLGSNLSWYRTLIRHLLKPPKASDFSVSLRKFTKHAKAAAREWKNIRENHGALFRGMANRLDPWWHLVAEKMPFDERLENAVWLVERFELRSTKPRDQARYLVATIALRFFEKFSPATPSYALTGSNPFIEFSNGLYELITGDEADLSTYARQVIEEAQGKRPSPYETA